MAARDEPQKWGSEHGSAMFRQGLRELRGAMYAESNVAQPTEMGIAGTKTPGEVASDRHSDGPNLEDETAHGQDSILGDRMRQAADRDGRGQDDKELEPER